jgi:diaminopimelate decarboxylase
MRAVLARIGQRKLKLLFEPGRNLVGNAGILLTRVEHCKTAALKNFVVVDAAMNDLLRPSLYAAHHEIVGVCESNDPPKLSDVVGPVCESGDFLGKERMLAVREGDLLAVMSAGAYGMAMASNYNTRPRAAEVLVDASQTHLVRKRETIDQLFALESIAP